MDCKSFFLIEGGRPLHGSIPISGAKNASIPLLCATLLTSETVVIDNLPLVQDIINIACFLKSLGVFVEQKKEKYTARMILRQYGAANKQTFLQPEDEQEEKNNEKLIQFDAHAAKNKYLEKSRLSTLSLGPLLASRGCAYLSLPEGCALGLRPINFHLNALEKMGAVLTCENDDIQAHAPRGLTGAEIHFPRVSVTGTENIMMAATLAQGETVLHNAAIEPEVVDLANFLKKMGANIDGIGTSTLVIKGVGALHGAHHSVIPDRIEMGTYILAVGIAGGDVELQGARRDFLPAVAPLCEEIGITLKETLDGLRILCSDRLCGRDMETQVYPGFPTDLQPQYVSAMCLADRPVCVQENIFENRFMGAHALRKIGADIDIVSGRKAYIRPIERFSPGAVHAADLRAGASLVLAGLAFPGQTIVHDIRHLDRGYARLEEKLGACGALIQRVG